MLFLFFETSQAQFDQAGGNRSLFAGASGVTIGATHQQWTIQDSGTVSQQSAPITVSVPLSNRSLMTITNSGYSSGFDTAKLSGLVDTRLMFSYVFPGDKFWLSGGVSVPTGKTKLTSSELQLSSLVSQAAFAYRTPSVGQGLNGNLSLVYAGTITRRMVLGIGLSYYYKGTYDPVKAITLSYDPGDEFSANLGFDYITFSKAARFSIDITGTYFLQDKAKDAVKQYTVFQSGPRAIVVAAYSLKAGPSSHAVQLRFRYRQPNTFYSNNIATKYDAALQTEGLYSFSTPLAEWLQGSAVAEAKLFAADQVPIGGIPVETGKANIVSAGVDGTFLFSTVVMPTLSLRAASGTVTLENKVRSVTGLEAGLGVRVMF